MIEENEPPWTKEMGCLSFTPSDVRFQTYKPFASRSYTRVQPRGVKQHYSEAIEKIGPAYACTRSKREEK